VATSLAGSRVLNRNLDLTLGSALMPGRRRLMPLGNGWRSGLNDRR